MTFELDAEQLSDFAQEMFKFGQEQKTLPKAPSDPVYFDYLNHKSHVVKALVQPDGTAEWWFGDACLMKLHPNGELERCKVGYQLNSRSVVKKDDCCFPVVKGLVEEPDTREQIISGDDGKPHVVTARLVDGKWTLCVDGMEQVRLDRGGVLNRYLAANGMCGDDRGFIATASQREGMTDA